MLQRFSVTAALALVFVALWSAPCRADLLATCGGLDELITCDATDVGKECQGSGQCFEMYCSNSPGSAQMKVYKCLTCPTIVGPTDGGICTPIGSPCGADGGTATCGVVNPLCLGPSATNKFLCQIPAPSQASGPPAGEKTPGGSSGGCDIAPRPPKPQTIGLGLLGLGVVLFAVDKLRRRPR